MRSKDISTLAEEVLPSIEGIKNVLESFSPLSRNPRLVLWSLHRCTQPIRFFIITWSRCNVVSNYLVHSSNQKYSHSWAIVAGRCNIWFLRQLYPLDWEQDKVAWSARGSSGDVWGRIDRPGDFLLVPVRARPTSISARPSHRYSSAAWLRAGLAKSRRCSGRAEAVSLCHRVLRGGSALGWVIAGHSAALYRAL